MKRLALRLSCLLAVAAVPAPATAQFSDTSPLAEWQSLDVAVLVERARAADVETRTRAACALRERRAAPPAAIVALVAMLPDDSVVPVTLCQAGHDLDPHGLLRTTSPGREAAAALAEAGAVAFEPLVKALEHASPVARRNGALGLGMLDDARAVTPLIARPVPTRPARGPGCPDR